MMKLRKTLVTLLVLSMILAGFTGVAGATFSDTANSAAKNKIEKLAALGVLAGYPDGTFKPDNNITRAEFAKIACVLAGLKSSGDILKNSPSKFSDVAAGEWFTGWVNLAVSQGYMKGYPDGTFKPQANISNAEVLTVLCRLLGYSDNLPGEWPIEYLVKAADLDISKGLTFDSSAPATRANVCWFSEQSLEVDNVEWDKDKDKFVKIVPAETILSEAFEGGIKKKALCYGWEVTSDKTKISLYAGDGNGGFNPASADSKAWVVNKDVTLNGVTHVSGLANKIIDFVVNDDNEIIYAEVKAYGLLSDVEAEKVSNTRFKINDKTYNVNAGALGKLKNTVAPVVNKSVNGLNNAVPAVPDANGWDQYNDFVAEVWDNADGFDKVYALLNADGEVAFVYGGQDAKPGVVKSVNSTTKKITFKTGAAGAQNADLTAYNADATNKDKSIIVFRDGKVASVTDIQENDLLSVAQNANGYDYKLTARSSSATGTLQEHNAARTSFTIGGTSYKTPTAADASLSDDGGSEYKGALIGAATDFKDYLGKEAKVLLDSNGRIRYMISDEKAVSAAQYGVVAEVYGSLSGTGFTTTDIEFFAKDGKLHKYPVNSDSATLAKAKMAPAPGSQIYFDVDGSGTRNAGDVDAVDKRLVKFSLQSNGAIDTFEFVNNADNIALNARNTDLHTVNLTAGGWKGIEGAAVFDVRAASKDDWEVVGWKDLESAIANGAIAPIAVVDYKESSGDITYISVIGTAAISATTDYAMFVGKGYDSDGPFIKILDANGAVAKKTCVKNIDTVSAAGWASVKGDMISYTVSGSKIATITPKPGNQTAHGGPPALNWDSVAEVVRSGAKKIKIENFDGAGGAVYRFVDDDTLFFDFTNEDGTPIKTTLDGVQQLDHIRFEVVGNLLKWVVVVK